MTVHYRVPVWPDGDYWDDDAGDVKELFDYHAPWRICWRSSRRRLGSLTRRRSSQFKVMRGSRLGRSIGPVPLPFGHRRRYR